MSPLLTPRLPEVPAVWTSESERSFRRELESILTGLARLITPAPVVHTTVVRSGLDRQITHDVVDPLRQFLELEYQIDGGGWKTGANWTSKTIGVQYNKTVTTTAGKELLYEYRLYYRDETGQARYKGEIVNLADLQEVTSTFTFFPANGAPISDTYDWDFSAEGSLYRRTTGAPAPMLWHTPLPLPLGITVTKFEQRGLRANSADTCLADFRKTTSDITASSISSLTKSIGGGWDWMSSGTLSETIAADTNYFVFNSVDGAAAAVDAAVGRIKISYTRPTYKDVS